MAYLHPNECFQEYFAQERRNQPATLLHALVVLGLSGASTIKRKTFRVIYNLVIEDLNQFVELLKVPNLPLYIS